MKKQSDIEHVFHKVFTEENETINLDANQLNINCLTSKQNKFHLDSEGNLSVNSITTVEKDTSSSDIYNLIYPIGSIYLSVNSDDPATLFGGSWEQIANGRTLIGVDPTDSDFNESRKIGGEKMHKLVRNELPRHSHTVNVTKSTGGDNGGSYGIGMRYSHSYTGSDIEERTAAHNYNGITMSGGNDQAHNNMPPYFTCYIWERIA